MRRLPLSRELSVFTLLDKRLKMPVLGGRGSFCVDRSLVMLCGNEFVLVLREMIESGRGSIIGSRDESESLPRIGSGDGCMELLVVRTSGSGDMMGENCCGLEAIDELVIAEGGAVVICGCARRLLVWTSLGRGRRSCDGWEV